jgi:hypothetical protein
MFTGFLKYFVYWESLIEYLYLRLWIFEVLVFVYQTVGIADKIEMFISQFQTLGKLQFV